MQGTIYQINIKPETPGERGLPKKPIEVVVVTFQGIVGDFNRWRHEELNDDLNKAILVHPIETIIQLNNENWPIKPGDLGENFTTKGVPYEHFAAGQRYCVGEAEIQIAEICKPCGNLKHLSYVGQEKKKEFIKTLKGRRGWYARVLKEGRVKIQDSIKEL